MRKGAASRNTAWDISPPDQTRLILGVPNETWQSSDRDLFGCYWQRLGPRDPAAAQHTRTLEKDASLSGCNAFFGREKLDHSAAIFERSDARRHGRALRTDLERAIERSRGLNEPVHLTQRDGAAAQGLARPHHDARIRCIERDDEKRIGQPRETEPFSLTDREVMHAGVVADHAACQIDDNAGPRSEERRV